MRRYATGPCPACRDIGAKRVFSFLEDLMDVILGQNDPHQGPPPAQVSLDHESLSREAQTATARCPSLFSTRCLVEGRLRHRLRTAQVRSMPQAKLRFDL